MFTIMPDAQTLHLCSTLASLAFAAVFLCVWSARREQSYLLLWAASSALYAFTLIGLDLLGGRSAVLMALLFGLLPGSNVLLAMGVRHFHGKAPFHWWMVAPVAIATICYLVRAAVPPALGVAAPILLTVDTVGLAIATAIIAAALLREPAASDTTGQRIVGLALLGYVLVYLLIAAIQVTSPARLNLMAVIPMLADQLLLGVLNLALLAMPGERAQQRLREAALRDPLTKAWNRDGLHAQQGRLLRAGAAVIAIDLDRFKQINDGFGHAVGDRMLATLADLAQGLAEAGGGAVARLGGDEFVAVLPEPGPGGAQRFVQDLQQAIGATHDLPAWTVSLGMAKIFSGEDSFGPALQRADLNLYRAKEAGRNRAAA